MSGMWDVAAFRLRRYAHLRRQRRQKLAEAEAAARNGPRHEPRRQLALRKVAAQLRIDPASTQGYAHLGAQVILNDITHDGLRLYSEGHVEPGTEVAIAIEAPRPLYVRARVTFCYEFTQSGRIIRGHHYPYRVGLEFVFESELERVNLAGYCRELRDRHVLRRVA